MRGRAQGFTLIEILLALAFFAIVIVGALATVGASGSGHLETVPTGLATARSGRDITAAAVYLQALHECAAAAGGGAVTPGTTTYTSASTAAPLGCTIPNASPPPTTLPLLPSEEPYQLQEYTLTVTFDTLQWGGTQYGVGTCDPSADADCLVRMRSTLAWSIRGVPPTCTASERIRGCLTVQRVLPP